MFVMVRRGWWRDDIAGFVSKKVGGRCRSYSRNTHVGTPRLFVVFPGDKPFVAEARGFFGFGSVTNWYASCRNFVNCDIPTWCWRPDVSLFGLRTCHQILDNLFQKQQQFNRLCFSVFSNNIQHVYENLLVYIYISHELQPPLESLTLEHFLWYHHDLTEPPLTKTPVVNQASLAACLSLPAESSFVTLQASW